VQLTKLTGLRIAAEGLARDVLAALGANPLQVAPDGIANALADGSIDAADLSSAEIAASLGVTRAGSRFFTASITNQGSPLVVSFRRALWDDLSMEQRACVEATVRGHAGLSRVSAERNASSFTAALSSAFGCIGNETPPWMAAARRISEAVVADLASRNPQCERINGAYMTFVSRTRKTDCASTS
jgi:TRAP-type mannitol/chloroaromatic compound transport system substrate-binding protein